MATNFLELATTLKYLGAKWLPGIKVNFMPCISAVKLIAPSYPLIGLFRTAHYNKLFKVFAWKQAKGLNVCFLYTFGINHFVKMYLLILL